jgi:amino acid adenylation domain-containing protein
MSDRSDIAERRSRLSPAKLALLEKRLRGKREDQPSTQAIPRDSTRQAAPLSFGQERLWFLDRYSPGDPVYNSSVVFRLSGVLDQTALEKSLNEIVRRHEVLRTTFGVSSGQPVQIIAPSLALPLPVVDLTTWPGGEREAEALRLISDEMRLPFDLAKGPLLRASLFRLDGQEHLFCLVMHHIVNDAWSRAVFFRELGTIYDAFSRGEPSPLPELSIQYADYAVWQREWLEGHELEQKATYWKQQLDAAAMLELPTDYSPPAVQTHRGAQQTLELPASLARAVQALCQQHGATPYMVLLAAFSLLLHRYSGQDDIVVGAPVAGRMRPELEPLIGFFVNSLVLRIDLSGNPTFLELLERVRRVTLEALAHQDLPFEKLLEELRVERDPGRTPLFRVFLNMHNVEAVDLKLRGVSVESVSLPVAHANFDLSVYALQHGGTIRLDLVYNSDLFAPARVREMAAQYEHLLFQIAADPGQGISGFDLLTPSAMQVLPDPKRPQSAQWYGPIHSKVTENARQNPQQLAVVDARESWTYGELDRGSNQLADYLLAGGIGPGGIVAIYGQRSASLVWAVLGILKAGAVFLILDPAYPTARLIRYLSLSKPHGWIQLEAAGPLPSALTEYLATSSCTCRIALPDGSAPTEQGVLAGFSDEDPGIPAGPDDPAGIVFTSGSTGEPKGVLGRHGSLTHFEPWREARYALTRADRFAMLSGLAYSPVQRDIFTPLWLGATVYMPDDSAFSTPGRLAAWMARQRISIANLTPPMAQVLCETAAPELRLPELRHVTLVGDSATRRDVAGLRRLAPNVTCTSEYGATETQRANACFVVPEGAEEDRGKALYPLGDGMPDVQLLVLNGVGRQAGVGELGEISMRSPHLALGYLGDEALTRVRFVRNPFTGREDDRLYRTGDLGRYLPDGSVEFVGRADRQVKIRGFRIELAEIEAVLEQHPGVRQCAVLARDDAASVSSAAPGGDRRLVGYVVPQAMPGPAVGEMRSFLRDRLPDYMVPSTFVLLDALPLTPNGKLNLAALPAPDQVRSEPEAGSVGPRDDLERQLARIWEEVLRVQPIGIGDDFFDLGGHSLLGIRLFARIEKELGEKLPIALLFRCPTVEQLAQTLRSGVASPASSALIAIQPGGSRPPLFCVHGWGGGVLRYAELARLLGPEQPFYGLLAKGESGLEEPDVRIEDMAAHCIQAVRMQQPQGPYYLGGYCLGGVVAYEMARQLQAEGERLALLAVLEGYAPGREEAKRQLRHPRVLSRFAVNLPRWLRDTLREPGAGQRLAARLRRRLRHADELRGLDGRVHQAITARFGEEPDAPESLRRLMIAHLQAVRSYRPQPYAGRVTLFRVQALALFSAHDPAMGWGKLATGGVEVRIVAGAHYNMLERPHVAALAVKLKESLEQAQEQASTPRASSAG